MGLNYRYVTYCMNLVQLLLTNGVIPVLVFDGQDVPIKEKENKKRAEYVIFLELIHLDNENYDWKRQSN